MVEYHRFTWSMSGFPTREEAQERLASQHDWFDLIFTRSEFSVISIITKTEYGWRAYFEAETNDKEE